MDPEPTPVEPDPEPEPIPIPEDGLSGWVVILFSERVPPGESNDLFEHVIANDDYLGPLLRYLRENSVTRGSRLVTSVSVEQLLRDEDAARDSDFPPLESLTRYWRIDTEGTGRDPEQVARELLELENDRPEELRGIANAYAEMTVENAGTASAVTLTAATAQGWLRQRHEGVNAVHAWTLPDGGAEGVRIVDIEDGWMFDHPDIAGLANAPLVGINRFSKTGDPDDGDHGTSVLGILAGRTNSVGGSGIALRPQDVAVCSHYDGTTAVQLVDALTVAKEHLSAGDILLIEVQRPRAGYLCVETDDAIYTAIRAASAKKIVVVEAAGNGRRDLSAWKSTKGRRLDRSVPELDSGAILVGAARKNVNTDAAVRGGAVVTGHSWNAPMRSNYGKRVDCYAWGEAVQAPVVDGYAEFSGTSSAAAIIAGVAAVTQGIQLARGGTPLDPVAMRALLAGPGGTPQVPVASRFTIGVMPDLETIAAQLPLT
jgi:hypothetical protein